VKYCVVKKGSFVQLLDLLVYVALVLLGIARPASGTVEMDVVVGSWCITGRLS